MSGGRELALEHDAAGRHEDAINALAVASRSGDVEAMAELGQRLIVGDRAPYMPEQGAGLLGDAARAGSINALLSFACLMALGAHVPRSLNGALGLLVHAAELGSDSARGQLRVLARQAAAGSPCEDWRQLARAIDLAGWLSPPPGITLHDEPLVRRFPALLEPALCDWLIDKARIRLRPAMIYSGEGAGDKVDEMRTNSVGVWNLGCMDLINVVLQYRIAAACRMPIDNLEAPTALRYRVGEQITNHYDYLNPRSPSYQTEIATRGERVITFLTYLNDDYDGGETDFPMMKLHYKGKCGDGLFFCNALPSTLADDRSLHAGLPPTRGEKWLVSQFVRSKAVFNTPAENVA
jgi:prolyl 4-hydroxylase